jgi:predicted nucleotidyltransferase component of viral defense system
MVLSRDDLEREMSRYGVAEAQVQRDHAISHVLAALTREAADLVTFFGGTALSRTYLTEARLSEDIDLIARAPRGDVIDAVRRATNQGLLRSHGRVTWAPDFSDNDVEPAIATTSDGVSIRVQVLRGEGYPAWPVEFTDLEQRYADAGPARLSVPTVEAFAGWKTTAWFDRHAPRDLYDLLALATDGRITPAAAQLFATYGPTGGYPQSFMFNRPPTEQEWVAQLAAQTRLTTTANEALITVRGAWKYAVAELTKASPD